MQKTVFEIAAMALVLAGCAETLSRLPTQGAGASPVVPNRDAFIAAGATLVANPDLMVGDRMGITFPQGTVTYYADGRKIMATNDGSTIERRWTRRADGTVCEELVQGSRDICVGDPGADRLYRLGSTIIFFDGSGRPGFVITETGDGAFTARPI